MAGFLSVANSDVYHSFISTVEEGVENGVFVTPDYTDGTAKLAEEGDTDIYFVVNENTDAPEWGIDDIDFKVEKGKFLRAHKPSAGEVFVTTNFEDGLKQGDHADVGAKGTIHANADGRFVVKAETTAFGTAALSLLYLGSQEGEIDTP